MSTYCQGILTLGAIAPKIPRRTFGTDGNRFARTNRGRKHATPAGHPPRRAVVVRSRRTAGLKLDDAPQRGPPTQSTNYASSSSKMSSGFTVHSGLRSGDRLVIVDSPASKSL